MVVNFKGGASKSTTAISLAVCANQQGLDVLLIDTDPQKTALHWFERRQEADFATRSLFCEPYCASFGRRTLQHDVNSFDLVIVDTGAGRSSASLELMRQMDLCLVPLRPTALDIDGTIPTIAALKSAECAFAFVLTQNYAGHSPRREETLRILQARGIVSPVCLAFRVDHQDALAQGSGVTEFSENGRAAEEVRALWGWLEKRLMNATPAA